jgi:hypothetical protein
MTLCRADSWTSDVYLSFFNSSINQLPDLKDSINNMLDDLDEMGYYVFSPTKTMDMEKLREEYLEFIDLRHTQKEVEVVAGAKTANNTPNCKLFNFGQMHNKKVAILGLLDRHTPTIVGKEVKTVFRDPTNLLPNLAEKVLQCEMPSNSEYFSMNQIVRKLAKHCLECKNMATSEEDGEDEMKCKHVYEICDLDGSRRHVETEEELATYLDASSKEHFCILIGTMFGITSWTGYYKFSLAADKLYVLSQDIREKVCESRRQEKRQKRDNEES